MTNPLPMRNDNDMQWRISGPRTFAVCGKTVQELPAGAYSCWLDNCGQPHYAWRDLQVDELIDFSGSLPSQVLDEVERFWATGERFARYGFLHRRGYLFYG